MEIRDGNIIVGAAGGTAGKNAKTYKVSIPSAWAEQMGLDSNTKNIQLAFDGRRIVICKKLGLEEFLQTKRAMKHAVKTMTYYDNDRLCTRICADFTDSTLAIENTDVPTLYRAFGKNESPSWGDFMNFLEERCIPRQRDGLRHYLDALGLDEYEPLEIVRRTKGKMAEDSQWLEVEDIG